MGIKGMLVDRRCWLAELFDRREALRPRESPGTVRSMKLQ